jgi:hypothetical protein
METRKNRYRPRPASPAGHALLAALPHHAAASLYVGALGRMMRLRVPMRPLPAIMCPGPEQGLESVWGRFATAQPSCNNARGLG